MGSAQVPLVGKMVQSAAVNGAGHLILTLRDGTTMDAGYVVGPQGANSPPSGAAGGDLGGNYPNPTILKDSAAATASMRTLGAGATQAMAGNDARVVAAAADTGWSTLTTTGTSGNTIQWRVKAGVFFMNFGVTLSSSLAAGSSLTVVTSANAIPAAYRPAQITYGAIFVGTAVGFFSIGTDGTVTMRASTGAMTSGVGATSYPLG